MITEGVIAAGGRDRVRDNVVSTLQREFTAGELTHIVELEAVEVSA